MYIIYVYIFLPSFTRKTIVKMFGKKWTRSDAIFYTYLFEIVIIFLLFFHNSCLLKVFFLNKAFLRFSSISQQSFKMVFAISGFWLLELKSSEF